MIHGWVEQNGEVVPQERADCLSPEVLKHCGGEFYSDEFGIQDKYGIYPAPSGQLRAEPIPADMPLSDAVIKAVELRACAGSVVTLSGGVDSSLVAVLSGLPAISVGTEGAPDLLDAQRFADAQGISLNVSVITEDDVWQAFPAVVHAIPSPDPMSVEIACTGYFVAKLAKSCGASRVLTGQAADELFAGYARYSRSSNLRAELEKDFALLDGQRRRDSAAAALHGVWYSLPYMDERVVRAAKRLSPEEIVSGDLRKIALRKTAEHFLPKETAWKPKKAMQYGSGVSKLLARMAKREGVLGTAGLIEAYLKKESE